VEGAARRGARASGAAVRVGQGGSRRFRGGLAELGIELVSTGAPRASSLGVASGARDRGLHHRPPSTDSLSTVSDLSRRLRNEDPPRVLRVGVDCPGGEQGDGARQELVLERAERGEHLLGAVRVRQLHGPLQDHRACVDARVDEVDGHAEHLTPYARASSIAWAPGKRGAERGER